MAMMCSINGPQSSATANRNTRVSRSTAWRGLDQSRLRSSAFPELIYDAACLHDDITSAPSGLKGSGCWEAAPPFPSRMDRPKEVFHERNFSFIVYNKSSITCIGTLFFRGKYKKTEINTFHPYN